MIKTRIIKAITVSRSRIWFWKGEENWLWQLEETRGIQSQLGEGKDDCDKDNIIIRGEAKQYQQGE